MSGLRVRRLKADYEAVRRLAHLHPRIEVEGVQGNPPERYLIKISTRSLREHEDRIVAVHEHRLEITLPLRYPRDPPLSRMLTPVFHPNIAPHAICVGDDWSAAESLDSVIQRIGEMLCFQSYNIKSPLNGRAARWVEENAHRLPIDPQEFFLDLAAMPDEPVPAETRCANCGAGSRSLVSCPAGHELCPDCSEVCPTCGRGLCLLCGTTTCAVCTESNCSNCGRHLPAAWICNRGHALCPDCAYECPRCETPLCLVCGEVQGHACPHGGSPG